MSLGSDEYMCAGMKDMFTGKRKLIDLNLQLFIKKKKGVCQ